MFSTEEEFAYIPRKSQLLPEQLDKHKNLYDRNDPLSGYEKNYDEHIRGYAGYSDPEVYKSEHFPLTVNALKNN